jgi:hypothetical protein
LAEYLPEVVEPTADGPAQRNARIVEKLRAAARLIELASKLDGELPEVMSVGVTGEEITVQPWLPGAPVQALQSFEALMTTPPPIDRKAYPLVLEGAERVSLLSITGEVEGQQVTVTAATHQDTPVDGFLGVAEATVANLAANETPIDLADPIPDLIKDLNVLKELNGGGPDGPGPAELASGPAPEVAGPDREGAEVGAEGAGGSPRE